MEKCPTEEVWILASLKRRRERRHERDETDQDREELGGQRGALRTCMHACMHVSMHVCIVYACMHREELGGQRALRTCTQGRAPGWEPGMVDAGHAPSCISLHPKLRAWLRAFVVQQVPTHRLLEKQEGSLAQGQPAHSFDPQRKQVSGRRRAGLRRDVKPLTDSLE